MSVAFVDGKGRPRQGRQARSKKVIYMCQACGYMSTDVIPVKCPMCGAPGKQNFRRVK